MNTEAQLTALPDRFGDLTALTRLELLGYLAPTAIGTFTRTLLIPPPTPAERGIRLPRLLI